jgi:RNA polymerase sigma factor for flagellar operon FliA
MNAISSYVEHRASRQNADELVRTHADLVRRIAYHLCARLPSSVDIDDLVQAGMIGLLEAAGQFQDGKGASFETYAGIRIRGAMLDSLRHLDWTPRSVHRRARELSQVIQQIERETGSEATPVAIAARMGIAIDEYHRIVQDAASCHLASLEDMEGVDPADEQLDPLRVVADGRFREALAEAINGLPEREKLVMSLYYQDEMNLKEVGMVLGVTESRVSQLHGQAVSRLKARLSGWKGSLDRGRKD